MCMTSPSESGHGGRFEPCEEYIKLLSEKSRLEGHCAGLELGNKINLESIKRQDERMMELLAENEALRQERETILSIIDKIRWDDRGRYKSCRLCYRNYFLDHRLPFRHEPDCPLKGMFKEDEEASHAG